MTEPTDHYEYSDQQARSLADVERDPSYMDDNALSTLAEAIADDVANADFSTAVIRLKLFKYGKLSPVDQSILDATTENNE